MNDQLWKDLMKGSAFGSDEEAMRHVLAMALYRNDPTSISSKLILVTGKVKVECVKDEPEGP